MPKWSDHLAIKQIVSQKWDTGRILRNTLEDNSFFPLRIKLKSPTSEEMNMHFSEMLDWIKQLKRYDKSMRGYGYILEEKEVHHRLSGKNMIPTHAIIPTLGDAVRLLEKQSSLRLFEQNAAALLQEWECLFGWVLKKPFDVVDIGGDSDAVLQVLRWFTQHEQRKLYLRQLDIEGVDTKFIETHKQLFIKLLDIVLPPEQVDSNSNIFEKRYGLKTKPNLIRFRILDERLTLFGCTDISLPMEQFRQLQIPFSRVFIVENEINFLSFPSAPSACVIFGGGYGVDACKDIPWLGGKDIYYWGDIDTHGLNILSMVRCFLPQTQSFLMSEDVMLAHRSLWSKEVTPFMGKIAHLTPQEHKLTCDLQEKRWGEGVRLEQERIRFSSVESFVAMLPSL